MKSNYDLKKWFKKLSLEEKRDVMKDLYGEDVFKHGSVSVTLKMRREIYNHLSKKS